MTFFCYFSKQIKKSIHLTIIENGYGNDDAVNYILIDAVLKENFEKVNYLKNIFLYFEIKFFFSFWKIVQKD